MPSVVSIKTEQNSSWGKKDGIGTGVIFDDRGYAVTNRHVVNGAVPVWSRCRTSPKSTSRWSSRTPTTTWPSSSCRRQEAITALHLRPRHRPEVGRDRHRHRPSLRLHQHGHHGHHQRAGPGNRHARRRSADEPDPAQRLHQPGQLGRPAGQHQRRADRHQRGPAGRRPGHRLRPQRRLVQKVLARHLSANKMSRVTHGLVVT